MRKDAHPSGGVGSSNPCRWNGDGVGELCFLCGFYSTKVGRRKWREPYFEFLRVDGTTPPKKIIREIKPPLSDVYVSLMPRLLR